MTAYRWLLRAYPPGPRRDELLDTMLMAAADAGRGRPTVREFLDVLRNAPRARLGRPASPFVVPVAVVVALLTGFLAASASAALIGESGRPLPTAAEMTRLTGVVAPGAEVAESERHERLHVNGAGEAEFGYVRHYAEPTDQSRADLLGFADAAATRLRADGWRTGSPAGDGTLTATRDGLVLRFENAYNADIPDDGGVLRVLVRRAEPAHMPAVAIGAGVLGLALGWLLAGWASRRTEHLPGAGGLLAALTGTAAVTLAPLVLLSATEFTGIVTDGHSDADAPFWRWLRPDQELFVYVVPALLALVVALAVVARGGRAPMLLIAPVVAVPLFLTGMAGLAVLLAATGVLAWLFTVRRARNAPDRI